MSSVNIRKLDKNIFGKLEDYIATVPKENLTPSVKKQMRLISFAKNFVSDNDAKMLFDKLFIIGSYGYRQQKYWGDVDMHETIVFHGKRRDILNSCADTIKKIVSNYTGKKDRWFVELKCGIDKRFSFIDPLGGDKALSIEQIPIDDLIQIMKELKQIKAIKIEDYKKIMHIIGRKKRKKYFTKNDNCDMEEIIFILRKYYVIRWNEKNIQDGYIRLPGKKLFYDTILTLTSAINNNQPINIECIANIDGTLLNISNFFIFEEVRTIQSVGLKSAPKKPIDRLTSNAFPINYNAGHDYEFYINTITGLMNGINEVITSCIKRDTFKGMKRLWSLGRLIIMNEKILGEDVPKPIKNFGLKESEELIEKLVPYISSDISNLNSVKNGISVLGTLIDIKPKFFPKPKILKQITQMKFRMGKITQVPTDLLRDKFNPLLDDIYSLIKSDNYDDAGKNISLFVSLCSIIINGDAIKYMQFIGLLPTPYEPPNYFIDFND